MIKDNSLLSDVLPDTNILLAEMWLFQYTVDGEIVFSLNINNEMSVRPSVCSQFQQEAHW